MKSAFCAALRGGSAPWPYRLGARFSLPAMVPTDVLEVHDLDQAIACAEEMIRKRHSSMRPPPPPPPPPAEEEDLFDRIASTPLPWRASTIPPPPLHVSPDSGLRLPALSMPYPPLPQLDEQRWTAPPRRAERHNGDLVLYFLAAVVASFVFVGLTHFGLGLIRARTSSGSIASTTTIRAGTVVETPSGPELHDDRPKGQIAAPDRPPAVPVRDVKSLPPPRPSRRGHR